jgi:hypothetical protein
MSAPSPSPRRSGALLLVAAALPAAALVFTGVALWRFGTNADALAAAHGRQEAVLQQVLGEVTRMRIEQSTGTKGPQALLEKLRVYAPLMADARTTEPDYQNAKKEMEAILRAFATIGKDAWQPIQDRIAQLQPDTGFEELKQLLRASVAVDRDAGTKLLEQVLLGHALPAPRLRWYAAHALIEHDRPLAQARLRQVLLTESSRGFDPAHAAAFPGASVPDRAALSATGFFNFVVQYVKSGDPQLEDTLLQVMGRTEHDLTTLQECVKALGERRSAKAVPAIERLYTDPPLQQQNPIFLGYCLQALVDIQGAGAKPFLEKALANAGSDVVATKIQALLTQIANGAVGPPRAPASDQKGR